MKAFPRLYKKSSAGKLLSWEISVDGAAITETWGQAGGKMQSTVDTIKEGKNLGRANATTPETQALAEAQGKWDKKLKGHNYNESEAAAMKGEASDVVEGGVLPMLAHKFSEHAEKIAYPACVQPKLDGHRMTSQTLDGETSLWTRTRKQMFSCPHIVAAIDLVWARRGNREPVHFDGEGYNHGYRDKFEELTHYLKQVKYVPGSEAVQYHIYDIAEPDMAFEERRRLLDEILSGEGPDSPLKRVETVLVSSEDELMLAFERFRAQGYEGAMVRNAAGLYVNKRSYDLQKIKEFDDAEYAIVGVSEGRGNMAGHAVFVCETSNGTRFEAKMKGERAALRKYWDSPELCIGRTATVQYQGLTGKNKVPRFPVAVRLRETEDV